MDSPSGFQWEFIQRSGKGRAMSIAVVAAACRIARAAAKPKSEIQSVLAQPENMAQMKQRIGLEVFVIFAGESRPKQ
jgi:hypothetical protein